jgi:hypothetical protein
MAFHPVMKKNKEVSLGSADGVRKAMPAQLAQGSAATSAR